MRPITLGLTACLLGTAAQAQMACEDATTEALGLSDARVTSAEAVPAGEGSPAHCLVNGVMAERTGMDGRDYALRFALALPDDWNGRFVHQFNGGSDGEVKAPTGAMGSGTGETTPLERGYAVVSSDAGHDGAAVDDAGLAGGTRFGFDFEARRMYGYGAVETLDPVARDMIEAFYAAPIEYAYGVGCSNGGRHAMVAASRMPEAFDGILATAPGYLLPKAALQHAVDVQALSAPTGDLASSFPAEDLALVATGVRAACDALDGLEDGMVQDVEACQSAFDIGALQCTDGQNDDCLSEAQVTALSQSVAGSLDGSDPVYSDWYWDTGIESGNWRFWKLESQIPPWGNLPLIAVMGSASLAQVFTTPPTQVAGDPDSLLAFVSDFDLSARADAIDATTEDFPESAMEVMTPPGWDDPQLAGLRDAGGKLIVAHGTSDPVFSARDTADWYQKLDANNGDNAEDFALYYPVPGMAHCSGGPTLDGYDLFAELVDWVENDSAPEAVTVAARPGNDETPAELAGATRPLCPAPTVARYTGEDPQSADSFTCE
ncbi:tannase/feruloyl esterase family alpha/beta hydrolase [Salipiger sp. IMCC34102]|uniref:tannase/feruloyl esterase family alpha/beta hydrolase n=1 Tax=Salipiger sp. IMCC34102 TaxID=2510647 RepID=UPI00101CFDA0|nr:tannase/feruloyl esterase family alpha/beta hydrolase [Salipiger sp. IMCC34102]RYH03796.1 tannase/feruloyl esterase family alpha/beta hydrolase [Salipiger sp. IMCC34102]